MTAYLSRRLLLLLPTLLLVSLLIFALLRVMPGDVAGATLGETASAEQLAAYQEQLGLDRPLPMQYLAWLADVVRLDLGASSATNRSVAQTLRESFPVTAELVLLSITLASLIGLPLGIIAAVNRGGVADFASRLIAIVGLSVPVFVLGLLAMLLPVLWWGWSPPVTYHAFWEHPQRNLAQFALPAAILAYRLAAVEARMTRSSMLDVLGSDFIRTARAKGLGNRAVWLRHALRNALVPVVTIAGTQVVYLIGGAVIVEQIFALPGIGRALLDAVTKRDYVTVQGIVLAIACCVVVINLAVDLLYAVLDPKLRAAR
jgi:peptide/nickel transport system permease protein